MGKILTHRLTFPILALRQTVSYDPFTGLFQSEIWSLHRTNSDGYKTMRHKPSGLILRQHRAAYAFMTGYWPSVVDHINRNRSDNRWTNLRACSQRGNDRNRANAASPVYLASQRRRRCLKAHSRRYNALIFENVPKEYFDRLDMLTKKLLDAEKG